MNKIIGIGALVLCVLFFTLPLVQFSYSSSYTATGFQSATGTGDLFEESGESIPLAFILIIIPVILTIKAFKNSSFSSLRNVSIAGLVVKIIFLIYANILLNSDKYGGLVKLTGNNWFVGLLYVGLIGFCQYYIMAENRDSGYRGSHYVKNKKCRQCENIYSGSLPSCPKCYSHFYEETNQSISSSGIQVNYGDAWTCKKCGEKNPITSSTCKGCGEYK